MKELAKVIKFPFHVSVVDTLIAFSTAPENIVLSTESMGDFHCFFDLGGGIGVNI